MQIFTTTTHSGNSITIVVLSIMLLFLNIVNLTANEATPDSLKTKKVFELEGIRIYGEFTGKTIGAVDIKEITPAASGTDTAIGNLIKDMAGVMLTEKGKGESVVRLRGFEDRHIRVFIDGMPISDGYFGSYDLHLITANNVSQVHLIKGPVSHQYGFNTMGGILNIITDKHHERNTLNSKLLYSSHGKSQTSINASYGLGRSQLYMNAAYLNSPGFVLPGKIEPFDRDIVEQAGEKRTNSAGTQYSVDLRLLTDIGGLHSFDITTGYSYMPRKGNPPSIYAHEDNLYSKIENWRKINTSISSTGNLREGYQLAASTYYDQSEDTYIRYNNANYDRALWSSLIRNNTLGMHLNLNHSASKYFNNDFGLRVENKSYKRSGGPGYEGIWVDNNQSLRKLYHIIVVPDQRNRYALTIGNALSSFSHSQEDSFQWFWEPQAGLIYRFGEQSASLSYGLANQFPTMRQLFSSTSGNPDLKPEKAHKLEATFDTPLSVKILDATMNLSLFYNRVDDLISRDRTSFYNQERMSTYGGEVSLEWNILPFLTHDYEISYLQLDKENSTITLMEYPELKLRLNHSFKLSDDLRLQLSTQWYDKSVTYYRDDDYFTLPSYWVNNFGINYLYKKVSFTINVGNLLDSYYEPQYGYPAAGREVTFAVDLALF